MILRRKNGALTILTPQQEITIPVEEIGIRRNNDTVNVFHDDFHVQIIPEEVEDPVVNDADELMKWFEEFLLAYSHEQKFQFLDTIGDGSGVKNIVGNYSNAPTSFILKPPAGQIYEIHRMIGQIRDAGRVDANAYGNNITLSNGLQFYVKKNSEVITDLFGGLRVFNNAQWARYCYDVQAINFGQGDEYVAIRWTFAASGKPLFLNGDEDEYLELIAHDDFRGLIEHYFNVQYLIV